MATIILFFKFYPIKIFLHQIFDQLTLNTLKVSERVRMMGEGTVHSNIYI